MIQLQSISKHFGTKTLLTGADALIKERARIALVGPNGSGKSTLIKIILGLEEPDSGQVVRFNNITVGHLAQEPPHFLATSVLSQVTAPLNGPLRGHIETEPTHDVESLRREARAKAILSGMGFRNEDFDRPLSSFSGGWLMRISICQLLLNEPDLLLLDEPTNHLDLETVLWLENFLKRFSGALLIVSHDTEFLNRTVNEVLEIDQQKLWSYKGNIESYAEQKEERMRLLLSQYKNQQQKIAAMEAFINRFKAKASKAKQAQSRIKQLEKMDRIELSESAAQVRFRFPPAPHSGKETLFVENASFGYSDTPLFRDLNWILPRGSRTAIVGVNGAGKTTLLKLLAGQFSPRTGAIKKGYEVKVGYYAQHQAQSLDLTRTIQQELVSAAPQTPLTQIKAIAGAFLFSGETIDKKCGVLSGGEKARVALAKLLLSPVNFLLLDEPTNHLDVESRGVLLEALQDFEGTLCLVSHDRAFVTPLVEHVLEIIPSPEGSRADHLVENYEDYLKRQERLIAGAPAPKPSPTAPLASKATSQDQPILEKSQNKQKVSHNKLNGWKKELSQIEEDISMLEERGTEIQKLISDPELYQDKTKLFPLLNEQKDNAARLERRMTRWEELSQLIGEAE